MSSVVLGGIRLSRDDVEVSCGYPDLDTYAQKRH